MLEDFVILGSRQTDELTILFMNEQWHLCIIVCEKALALTGAVAVLHRYSHA